MPYQININYSAKGTRNFLVVIGVLIWLSSYGVVSAQKPLLQHYDVADGLANSSVSSIFQDKKGFVWFGTGEGLSRFDGYVFVNYGVRDGLGQQSVNDIAEDKLGQLWVATNGGGVSLMVDSQMFELKHGRKFISFQVSDRKLPNQVNRILFDRNNNLWCLTDFGLYRASLNDIANLEFEPVLELESPEANSLIQDRQGRIWCGVNNELFEINDRQIINHGSAVESEGTANEAGNFISGIVETNDGKLLVSTSAALYESSLTEETRRRWVKQSLSVNGHNIYRLFQDTIGNLWFSVYDKKNTALKYQKDVQDVVLKLGGMAYRIRAIGEDNEDNLWFGTDGGGVYKFGGEAFTGYTNPTDSSPLITKGVFENHDEKIFGFLSDFSLAEITENEVKTPAKTDYISSLSGVAIIRDIAGELNWCGIYWCSAGNKPFIRLRNGQLISLKKYFNDSDLSKEFYFYEDENGSLWFVINSKEIYRLDARANSLLIHILTVENSVFQHTHPQIVSDRAGGLWFSARFDLCRLRERLFKCFQPTDGLPSVEPRSLFVDSRGWLWIGTRYNGVSITKNPNDEQPQFFNYSEELPSNTVWSITEDGFGRMYFGTERGVARFDIQKNRWRNFNSKNGLNGDRIYALTTDSKGNIWISTYSGLTKFKPNAERREDKPPPIYLNHVNIAGEDLPMAEASASEIPLIELPSSHNNLTIEFVGLNYTSENSLTYQYKLEGGEEDWSAPNQQRVVNYALLGAGNYRFLVRAVNREGLASLTPASFEFRILPPVWQRWWFLLLTILTIALITYSAYKYRLRRLLELEKVRTRIATDLHDDIGANLTRISLLSEVAKQKSERGNGNLLTSIADIARESVASMNDIVWAISPEHDSLLDLTRRMRRHAEEVFTMRDIDLDFKATDANLKLSVGVRRDVLLIFKEAVNNAAKHSDCSKVTIDFSCQNSVLSLRIQDDGRGFETDANNEGQGLRSMTRRAAALGGSLTIVSDDETLVDFKLPLTHVTRA